MCYLHPSSAVQLQRTAIGFVWFGVLLHWSRYWFGTALHLSTVSYTLVLGHFNTLAWPVTDWFWDTLARPVTDWFWDTLTLYHGQLRTGFGTL
jgi:hypothetical protein